MIDHDPHHGLSHRFDIEGSMVREIMGRVRRPTPPLAPVEDFGRGTVLDTLLISYVFSGVEEIGVEIEDPSGHVADDLPPERRSDRIGAGLRGLAGPA